MNAGDVVQLVGAWAQVPADQERRPERLGRQRRQSRCRSISFNAIAQMPDCSVANADHMEETVLPAEVIGKEVHRRAAHDAERQRGGSRRAHLRQRRRHAPHLSRRQAAGRARHHQRRRDGADSARCRSDSPRRVHRRRRPLHDAAMPFIVEGDQPFAVASFMVGGTLQMPGTDATTSQGDPAMTMMVTPEQFRQGVHVPRARRLPWRTSPTCSSRRAPR